MAETFHVFSDLPKELRLKIWEQAMIEDRPNRRILLYQGRVVPFKQFISPLLLVNQESRTCAKAFYNVKLDIYAVPPLSQDDFGHLDKKKHWDQIEEIERAVNGRITGYTDEFVVEQYENWLYSAYDSDPDYTLQNFEEDYEVNLKKHWSLYVWQKLCVLGAGSVHKVKESTPTAGVFYISPEHDVFIDDYEFGAHFCIDRTLEVLGPDFAHLPKVACRYISAKLSPATRKRVSTLVIMRLQGPGGVYRHCIFAEDKSIHIGINGLRDNRSFQHHWKKKAYPRVRYHFALKPLLRGPFPDFLAELTDGDNTEPCWFCCYLEQWGPRDENLVINYQGDFEVKKGGYYSDKSADWVRDLMAHWQVST